MNKKIKRFSQELYKVLSTDKTIQKELLRFFNDPAAKQKYDQLLVLIRPLLKVGLKLFKLTTREIEVFIAMADLVIGVSLAVKKNILDNPEVRDKIAEFFGRSAKSAKNLLNGLSEFIDRTLVTIRKKVS